MEEKKLVPKLRFPGFTEPWEQRKLGEIVKIERGGSPRPIDNYITTDADGLNWIKIGDAPEQGRYIVHAAEKIKSLGLSKTRQVEPGDLILSNSMSFGKPYIMGIHGCIHDGWLLIRNNQNIFDLKFLCNLLGTEQLHAQYRRLAAGSAVNNLNKELVSGTNVGVPSKAEQLKIGQFFESIDQYITLHQRKLEHLKLKKKSLLQKLFPKEGEVYPEFRFPGFTDPWEQRKLGDVVKRESVTQVSSTEYPAIEYEDVIPETGQLNKDIYKKGVQKVGILFDANKVLYGKLRPYLHNWVAPMYTGVAVGDWWVLNPCGLDRGFLYTLIQTVKFDTIANQSAGSKMPRADWKLLSTTEFSIPSLDEQIKIGKLVEGLNDYITLHQRKLEHLQLLKKALLQQLFV